MFGRTDWLLRRTKAVVALFACVSLATAFQNIAQHSGQRSARLFEGVRLELEQLRSLRWVGGNDTFLKPIY
jgi:hypothetical protein